MEKKFIDSTATRLSGMSARMRREAALRNANLLAALQPGTLVNVRLDTGETVQRTLDSMPWLMGGHSWVVKVGGITGGFCCSRVTPIPAPSGRS